MIILTWAIATAASMVAIASFYLADWTDGLIATAVLVLAIRAAWQES